MKIGIVGFGFVGKALFNALSDNVSVIKIDPKLGTNINDLVNFNADYIFICLPTPMSNNELQDISILKKVITKIKKRNIRGQLVIKSTVLPNYLEHIKEIDNEFIYNPEFLREKHANNDFIKSNLIVFGGNKENCKALGSFYDKHTKCLSKEYIFTDHTTASFIKYTINSFLATKVIFFNELNKLYEEVNSDDNWSNLISYIARDTRIGNSHMNVPGHDGRYGFGGACLPKDSRALYEYSEMMNMPLNLLNKAISSNNNIRSKYNVENKRELEQNVSYNPEDYD